MKPFLHLPALLVLMVTLACWPSTLQADPARRIRIDPATSYGTWDGWGTSLAWWAKALGDRDDIADLLFTTKTVEICGEPLPGLALSIVRYNLGACSWNTVGERQMAVSKKIPPTWQMEGFWLDGKSSDPASPSWNWAVDATQRAMLLKARDRGVKTFELFSNSPMWWMCGNDNPSGSDNGGDNLSPQNYGTFATYLATVARYAEDHWAIRFSSVSPFNEPAWDFWTANNRQEGCHFSHEAQAALIPLVRAALDAQGMKQTLVAASDDSLYDQAHDTWASFDERVRSQVGRVNVHGYQFENGRRDLVRKIVGPKTIWNTEYGEGERLGMYMTSNLHLDFRYLQPTAWCYWQPFDVDNWGLITADLKSKTLRKVSPKYYLFAQYTRHIRPGMKVLQTGDLDTVSAYDDTAHRLVIVARVPKECSRVFDLSAFQSIGGPVARWITEPKGKSRYEKLPDLLVTGKQLEVTLPADSVQTFEIENVR